MNLEYHKGMLTKKDVTREELRKAYVYFRKRNDKEMMKIFSEILYPEGKVIPEKLHSFEGKEGLTTNQYYIAIRDAQSQDKVLLDRAIKYFHRIDDMENKQAMQNLRNLLVKKKAGAPRKEVVHRMNYTPVIVKQEIKCKFCKHYGTDYKHNFANFKSCFEAE